MENINLQLISAKDVLLAGLQKRIEVIDTDWNETTYTLPIVEGVTVDLYEESEQGVLRIDDQYFEFLLTEEMAQILIDWDSVKPAELFSALHRNRFQFKVAIAV
ncbi:hypothetical protein [Paenisporosarcina sp. NPDC076898]|uniref:hypothetical protein n=1 Tax=unclassified Paenisporosarcina TaxID=2642018 RepID=UPI003D0294C4